MCLSALQIRCLLSSRRQPRGGLIKSRLNSSPDSKEERVQCHKVHFLTNGAGPPRIHTRKGTLLSVSGKRALMRAYVSYPWQCSGRWSRELHNVSACGRRHGHFTPLFAPSQPPSAAPLAHLTSGNPFFFRGVRIHNLGLGSSHCSWGLPPSTVGWKGRISGSVKYPVAPSSGWEGAWSSMCRKGLFIPKNGNPREPRA